MRVASKSEKKSILKFDSFHVTREEEIASGAVKKPFRTGT